MPSNPFGGMSDKDYEVFMLVLESAVERGVHKALPSRPCPDMRRLRWYLRATWAGITAGFGGWLFVNFVHH
jgi:hypothetical protein